MKIHPFIKSLILIIVFAIILFLARHLILTQASFEWFNIIEENKIINKIFYNLSLSSMISLSFTLPFLFFNKNTFWKFLKLTFSLSLITWILLVTIANDWVPDFFLFQMIDSISARMLLFLFFFPLVYFLITKVYIRVTIKLFFLLFLVCPLAFGTDSLNLFRTLFALPTNSDFNLFFSIILFLNFVSNFYFRNLNFQGPIHIEENILDAPDF